MQRHAINAYKEALKKKLGQEDPPLRFDPCYITAEAEDEVLSLEMFKDSIYPVLIREDEDLQIPTPHKASYG